MKQFVDDKGLVRKVYEKSLRYGGVGEPSLKQEMGRLVAKREELERNIAGFNRSVRDMAVNRTGDQDFPALIESLLKEKKADEEELAATTAQLQVAQAKERQLKATLEGQSFWLFLKQIMSRIHTIPARERKRAIQSLLVKVVILDDGCMELHIIPDPANPETTEVIRAKADKKKPAVAEAGGRGGNREVQSSGFLGCGGGTQTRTVDLSHVKRTL